MANLTDKLMQLRDELQADRDQNMLTNEGEVLLRNLESGVATESVGAALQGLTLNLSDEGIGWVRSLSSQSVPAQTAQMVSQVGIQKQLHKKWAVL
jgi:hypothetical protein